MASSRAHSGRRAVAAIGLAWLLVVPASIAVEIDAAGQVAKMPPISDHWVFVPDRLFQHVLVFDGDSGDLVGTIPSPGLITPKLPLVSRARGEIYSVDVDYSRGTRGERTDYVTVYDATTLDVRTDLILPSQFPETVVLIVDLETRDVVAATPIAGCAGVYATGPRRLATLCGDGTTVQVSLSAEGSVESVERSERFFDVLEDPVSMVGVRSGTTWLFVSFLGQVHAVDYADAKPVASPPWPLVSAAEREAGWRPGGLQPHALHAATGRLFVLMHEGEAGSHKDASPEIWAFDVDERSRRARFDVPNLAVEFLGPMFGLASGSFARTILGWVVPNEGAHSLVVSQDASPLLFTRSGDFGVVGVIDPESGDHVRTLVEAGLSGPSLGVP
jgi:methylamine dehydrogenase heavy chain